MSTDLYLRQVLARYAVDAGVYSPVRNTLNTLDPVLRKWGTTYIIGIGPSGSFSKGTAVHGGTDIDIFVSLTSTLTETLESIYTTLFNALTQAGYGPRKQNVSLGVTVGTYKVDVTPGRRQDQNSQYHSLYSNKTGSWLQTNVKEHQRYVSQSGRADEIRLMKIWRNRFDLDWPSFYLELFVINALSGARQGNLATNIITVLTAVGDYLATRKLIDPANTNNTVSDTLNATQKTIVAQAARHALQSQWSAVFA